MSDLIEYLSYPFVRYALIVGILISLCASLLGVTLVLKRFSFIGDGLSHVAFGAIAIAVQAYSWPSGYPCLRNIHIHMRKSLQGKSLFL